MRSFLISKWVKIVFKLKLRLVLRSIVVQDSIDYMVVQDCV